MTCDNPTNPIQHCGEIQTGLILLSTTVYAKDINLYIMTGKKCVSPVQIV